MLKKHKAGCQLISVVSAAALSLIFLLFLLRSDIAIKYMRIGLKLCSETVIPSLFPLMVTSSLLVSSGIGIRLFSLLAFPVKFLFGVSEGGACAFVLGTICGFPIGARTVCELYDSGKIGKTEAEHLLTFCNNPGSAFVVGAVGASLLGSLKAGIHLYAAVILSAILTGMLLRPFFKTDSINQSARAAAVSMRARKNFGEVFTETIRDCALSMLTVCATVAFFSSLVGCIGVSLTALGVNETCVAAIFGIFEISSGVGALSAIGRPMSLVFCAAVLGWSGLSVHLQIMAVSSGRGFSFAPYFVAKAVQGVISGALVWGALAVTPILTQLFSCLDGHEAQRHRLTVFLFGIMVFAVAILMGILIKANQKTGRKKF